MVTFKRDLSESRCIDEETNRRVLWLGEEPGRVEVWVTAAQLAQVKAQFDQYGVLGVDEIPSGPNDHRISEVGFACDLATIVDKMLDTGFADPVVTKLTAWLVVFQQCSRRIAEELASLQGEEGPPPRF